jgi:hypothetical protein
MRASDIVVVASRHDYPEGLPNTLCEGLASRTPVVISDHPAFASRLADGRDCLIFAAGDAASLADRISELAGDPALYAALSLNAPKAYASLYFGLEWTQLVRTFIADPTNATGWVERNSLRRLLHDRGISGPGQDSISGKTDHKPRAMPSETSNFLETRFAPSRHKTAGLTSLGIAFWDSILPRPTGLQGDRGQVHGVFWNGRHDSLDQQIDGRVT